MSARDWHARPPTIKSLDEAVNLTGVSRRLLQKWLSAGQLTPYMIAGDRRRFVDVDEVKRLRMPAPLSRFVGEVAVIPPNEPRSHSVMGALHRLGVPAHAHRTRPEADNYYSVQFPLDVHATGRADAIRRLQLRVKTALADVLIGTPLDCDEVRVEVVKDSVRGPSIP